MGEVLIGRHVIGFPSIELCLAVEALNVVRTRGGGLEKEAGIREILWQR